jgi:hypothetical protein
VENIERALSNDLNILTAEINSQKQAFKNSVLEINRRLEYVKENADELTYKRLLKEVEPVLQQYKEMFPQEGN